MSKCGRFRYLIFLMTFSVILTVGCAGRQPWPPVDEQAVQKPSGQVSETDQAGRKFTGVYHTVKEGETLWRIARTYGVDLETLQWVNDVEDVTQLRVGRVLFIPGVTKQLEVETLLPEQAPSKETIDLIWPLKGRITSRFGPRGKRKHEGVDIAAPRGTPVHAAASGKVAYSGNGMRGYGKVIVLKHDNDLSTVYAHNSALLVKMGDTVYQGETIARVGATGWATGPHLHFEVRRRGVPEDPSLFLHGL